MKAVKITGRVCREIEIENDLKALQRAVDGFIETITLGNDTVMIVDEEGLLHNKEINEVASIAAGTGIVGTSLVVGTDGEDFCDCPERIAKSFLDLHRALHHE